MASEIQTIRKGVIYSEYTIQSEDGYFWWIGGMKRNGLHPIVSNTFDSRLEAEADIIRTFGSL